MAMTLRLDDRDIATLNDISGTTRSSRIKTAIQMYPLHVGKIDQLEQRLFDLSEYCKRIEEENLSLKEDILMQKKLWAEFTATLQV